MMDAPACPQIVRIARIGLTTPNVDALAEFFSCALGFRVVSRDRRDGPAFEQTFGVARGAKRISLALGDQGVELLQFDDPGQLYPAARATSDLSFQHFAIVVSDMERAYDHLRATEGWQPISQDGPVQLPRSSASVTAFKFRDPDGHPLELLQFARDSMPPAWKAQNESREPLFVGIDHSAISVSDTAISTTFYRKLGLADVATTLNQGSAQRSLDDLCDVRVTVTALQPYQAVPHLELLCYHTPVPRVTSHLSASDVTATRLVLACEGRGDSVTTRLVRDPDGHLLELIGT